jgi:outer membrane receptor protein involved in Fe transport
MLRGHATQAFRAPTVYQSFPGFATVPASITLPGDMLPTFMPVQYFGNPDLEQEEALALGGGVQWQPVDPLSLSVDYWYYDYQNRIFQETPQAILASHFESLDDGGLGDPRVVLDPTTGDIARVQSMQVNSDGSVITHGLDFGVLVSIDGADFGGSEGDFGTFGVGATGTYTFSYEIPEARAAGRQLPDGTVLPPIDCEDGACEVAGKRNEANFAPPVPKLKASFPVTWSYSGHGLAFIPRFVSGVEDDAGPAQDGSFDDIDPWTTLDASYSFTIEEWLGKELVLRVGVLNLLDAAPPHANTGSTSILAAAYESLMHDPRGRMLWASVASEF